MQRRLGKAITIPFAIMTSGDTHDRTVALLAQNNNFGMGEDQIEILQQKKVASLADGDAHLSADPNNWSVMHSSARICLKHHPLPCSNKGSW